jgi:hypothetical protein
MGKRLEPLFSYNQLMLNTVSVAIRRNLTPDLLPKQYVERNTKNHMLGHCHTASGCLYYIFGSKHLHMYRALDQSNIWHWWVQDRSGTIIDLTAQQYTATYVVTLYKQREKASMLGFSYRTRVLELVERVVQDIAIDLAP